MISCGKHVYDVYFYRHLTVDGPITLLPFHPHLYQPRLSQVPILKKVKHAGSLHMSFHESFSFAVKLVTVCLLLRKI